jgi:hypothetical protein
MLNGKGILDYKEAEVLQLQLMHLRSKLQEVNNAGI